MYRFRSVFKSVKNSIGIIPVQHGDYEELKNVVGFNIRRVRSTTVRHEKENEDILL